MASSSSFNAPAGNGEKQSRSEGAKTIHAARRPPGISASKVSSLIEAKGFHTHDGTSISLARLGGIRRAHHQRISETVALRARDLRLEYVRKEFRTNAESFRKLFKRKELGWTKLPLSETKTSICLPCAHEASPSP